MKKGSEKKNGARKAIGIIIALLIVAALVFGFVKGYIKLEDGGKIHFDFNPKTPANTVEPANTVPGNTSDNTSPGGNTVPDNTSNTVPDNAVDPGNDTSNTVTPDNSSNTVTPDNSSNTVEPGGNSSENTAPDTSGKDPVYYTSADLAKLKNTEVFDKTAIEHIFIGTVNSQNKGSGYHYNMISDSRGQIIDGTRSKADKNDIYTANVEVDGHRKDAISSFYPDSWSPQDVVDAIVEARADALKTGKMRGNYHVGYSNGIRIELYLDSKNKVVTAYPVKNGK